MAKPIPSYRLDNHTGWRAAILDHVTTATGRMRLATVPGTARPIASPAGGFAGLTTPLTVEVDRYNRIYLLDGVHGVIKRYDPCTEAFETLPCLGGPGSAPRQFRDAIALLVDHRGDLHVLEAGNRRIQVFAADSFMLRRIWGPFAWRNGKLVDIRAAAALDPQTGVPTGDMTFPADAWDPRGIAQLPDGRIVVSDRIHNRLHLFDRRGCWRQSFDGSGGTETPLSAPTALATDRLGNIYVVEDGRTRIAIVSREGTVVERTDSVAALIGRFSAPAVAVDDDGTIWISDRATGLACRVYRDCSGRCLPPADAPRVPAQCALLAFDSEGHAILGDPRSPCLFRSDNIRYETYGRYLSEAFDSGLGGCVWDRVALDAAVPFGTRLTVETMVSEIAFTTAEADDLPEDQWTATPVTQHESGAWHCAVRSPPGRYLRLRLTLESDGAATVEIDAITVTWPRITSARYLPAVFAEEQVSADFFARFMEIFDRVRADVLTSIEQLPAYFDPKATPAAPQRTPGADFLDWLGAWIGLALDRNWSVARRRRLVIEAPKLFKLRGTVLGMKRHIAIYTGIEPRIVEHFRLRRWLTLDDGRLGDDAALWGPEIVRRLQLDAYSEIGRFQLVDGGDPLTDPFDAFAHRCTVYVPVGDGFVDADLAALEAIVELAKPAHVDADVRLMRPRFVIGCDTILGVNTVLGRDTRPAVTDESTLGEDVRLADPPPAFSLRPGLRLGHDTTLE